MEINTSQLLPLRPAEAGHCRAELATWPGPAADGGEQPLHRHVTEVRPFETQITRAAPPAARRALLVCYRYIHSSDLSVLRNERPFRLKGATPRDELA